MIRDRKVPAGPRPAAHSPTRVSKENKRPIDRPSTLQSDSPMLHASSSNNHSLFSFGRNGTSTEIEDPTTPFDFLPSVSFDDLQSSLESASTEFKLTQFPSPTGEGSILDDRPLVDTMAGSQPNVTHKGGTTRVAIQQKPMPTPAARPERAGSILRRPSNANRQSSASSSTSGGAGVPNAPTAPAAMRNRRQSHYPPVSNSNISKPPRKSIGPGVLDATDFGSRVGQKRRPSVASISSERGGADTTATSMDIFNTSAGELGRNLTASRTAKTRSVQPPPRLANLSANNRNNLTPEQNRVSTAFPRSPRAGSASRGSNPGSAKRQSIMPGVSHTSHATGLGARTISPTDAQRMKRMSIHQPSISQIANAPMPSLEPRASSRSPAPNPRKSSTPSSSRTTPDPNNRKSYSSGLSIGSNNSFNTHRTSTGSIQPRLPPSGSNSRLPAPKSLGAHPSASVDEEEEVPPVPAIPKVYESPKDSPAELSSLDKRKSNLTVDASSIHSSSTGTLSNPPIIQEPPKVQRTTSTRKKAPGGTQAVGQPANAEQKAPAKQQKKKGLQPLSLPPLNLGPLSTPTTAKIAALQERGQVQGTMTPPSSRVLAKTPTTPMTASKSSFFSRGRADRDPEKANLRSSSSVHQTRIDSPSTADATSSSESLLGVTSKNRSQKSVSPFVSSSVPKAGDGFGGHVAKSKSISDANLTIDLGSLSTHNKMPQKPTGPRAQKASKAASKSPLPLPSPEEPPTPSSMSTLRRKLSLSWKRSNSKSGIHVPAGLVNPESNNARQDSMPPPRIPISASTNLNSMKAPSPGHASKPSGGGSYLETRRRKSSASSLNAIMAQDRNKTQEVGNNSMIEGLGSSRNTSNVSKVLRPRPSASSIRSHDPYSAELDKDDLVAEDEMKKLGSRRKETELAARTLDALRRRATPKERVGAQDAIRIASLNIYERGEIVDYNDVYFCGTQNAKKVVGDLHSDAPNFGYDDDRGDYTIVVGDHLAYRYEIVDILGKGSFGQVVRCIDHRTGSLMAIKIIRNKKRFHQQALVEVNILQKLREWDPKNKHSMVNFTHSFYFRGHLCISTELLDMNLYEFIKSNSFRGFSLKLIRRFTKQMLSSLNLLKQHKVIHCDLKPENILLRHPMHSEIKVIDFGSSCFENEKVYTYIQSRFYRSPEVILGMTYGMPIDMWSLGCILAELYTGVPIFPGENEQEQLACIMEVFGPPEKHLIEKSTRKKLFFDSMGKPRLTVSSKGRRRRPSSKTLQQALKCDDEAFIDFLTRCLRWDPDRRMKPDEAIRHEFLTGQKTAMPLPRMAREQSPIKRHNTVSTGRPLPEPPKAGPLFRAGVSPHKPVAGTRRASGVNGPVTMATNKRTSTGVGAIATGTMANSNLPRVAGRSVSAKQDLASAGATAAMSRRA